MKEIGDAIGKAASSCANRLGELKGGAGSSKPAKSKNESQQTQHQQNKKGKAGMTIVELQPDDDFAKEDVSCGLVDGESCLLTVFPSSSFSAPSMHNLGRTFGWTLRQSSSTEQASVAHQMLLQQSLLSWMRRVVESEKSCLLYTSPSPRDGLLSRMPSSA